MSYRRRLVEEKQRYKHIAGGESSITSFSKDNGTGKRSSDLFLRKNKQDLTILRYMAQQVRVMLQVPGHVDTSLPWIYYLELRQRRTHRIAIYQPQTLLQNQDLAFVGFVSARQPTTDPKLVDKLIAADNDMLSELVHVAGLLSYSSL